MKNNEVFDWAEHEPVVDNAVDPSHWSPPRTGAVAHRPAPGLNPVNGHAMDCACSRCPGWYAARMQLGAVQPPMAPARRPNALVDQVIPVVILMVVFSLCSMVLIPVLMPVLALGALSLGLVAVSVTIVSIVGLTLVGTLRRAAREESGGRVVRGRVIRRR